jgi:hypothetical protein
VRLVGSEAGKNEIKVVDVHQPGEGQQSQALAGQTGYYQLTGRTSYKPQATVSVIAVLAGTVGRGGIKVTS